jgi:hypothetical protein
MDTISVFNVVVHLTGLLLIVPPKSQTGGSTPATGNLPTHVTEIGYPRATPAEHCIPGRRAGVCWVNMDGWSLDLVGGGLAIPTPGPVSLPTGATNLSDRVGKPVKTSHAGQEPGRQVRSRVTLRSGSKTFECGLAWWNISRLNSNTVDEMVLANVVEWTIPIKPSPLRLVRRRLDPKRGETNEELLAILTPNRGNTIDLFVQHIPATDATLRLDDEARAEANAYAQEAHRSAASRDTTSSGPKRATHFHAFYDLIAFTSFGTRPIPEYSRPNEPRCRWLDVVGGPPVDSRSPETLNCMVASGRAP